jgi:hypothetical protein
MHPCEEVRTHGPGARERACLAASCVHEVAAMPPCPGSAGSCTAAPGQPAKNGTLGCFFGLRQDMVFARLLHGQELALWSWPYTNAYEVFITDTLHQDSNGMIKHFVNALRKQRAHQLGSAAAEVREWDNINGRLSDMRHLPGARIPTLAFNAKQLNAEERRGMWKFLAVAANGTWPDDMVQFVAEYGRWQQLRDSPTHTESSVLHLKEWTIK